MSKISAFLFNALALTLVGIGNVAAQGAPEWREVRIRTLDSWHGPAMDMVVRSFTLSEPLPFQQFGTFVGAARVEFTSLTATDFEFGINADNDSLGFWSDTVLPPGTRVHLEPLDRLAVPSCDVASDPATETCHAGTWILRTAWILVR